MSIKVYLNINSQWNCHQLCAIDGNQWKLITIFICAIILTDASFGKKSWEEKKNEVVNYFNGQFAGRAHMKYTSQFIACKVLSILSIVSFNHKYIFIRQYVHIFPSKSIDFRPTGDQYGYAEHDSSWILGHICASDIVFARWWHVSMDDLQRSYIPENSKVHIHNSWSIRFGSEARRPLFTATECIERKDICDCLAVVHCPTNCVHFKPGLLDRHMLQQECPCCHTPKPRNDGGFTQTNNAFNEQSTFGQLFCTQSNRKKYQFNDICRAHVRAIVE